MTDLGQLTSWEDGEMCENCTPFLKVDDVLAAHAEHGELDFDLVKKAMGPNWPKEWDAFGPGEAIFAPEERRP